MKIYLILIILFLGTCRGSDNRTDLQSQNEIRLSCIDKSLCLVLDEYIRAHPEFNILTLTTNVDTIDFTFNIKGLSHKRPYMILGPAAERGFDEIDGHQRPYPSSFFVYGKYKIFVFSAHFLRRGPAAGAAPGRFRGAMLCHTTRRLAQTEGPHGFSAGVKQIAHFQNNNLSTFKIQCVQTLHSSNCLHTWNCVNAGELCKPCTVVFCTMCSQKSRCVQDNASLSELAQ